MKALKLPFQVDSTGGIAYIDNEPEAVGQEVAMAILTRPPERAMRFSYGSSIHDVLFEPTDGPLAVEAARVSELAVNRWVPRALVREVKGRLNEQENGVLVDVVFSLRTTHDRTAYTATVGVNGEEERTT